MLLCAAGQVNHSHLPMRLAYLSLALLATGGHSSPVQSGTRPSTIPSPATQPQALPSVTVTNETGRTISWLEFRYGRVEERLVDLRANETRRVSVSQYPIGLVRFHVAYNFDPETWPSSILSSRINATGKDAPTIRITDSGAIYHIGEQ